MLDWLIVNDARAVWVTALSVVMFLGSIIVAAIVVIRLPADYFAHGKRPPREKNRGIALKAVKNILGAFLLLAGLAMLVLPGQGVIMVLIGIMLLDIPGKYRLEKWLVSKGKVLKAMNWLRTKWDKPPLRLDDRGNATN
jgi:archaellum biogenesis protein FlaJ (TadC family)